MNQLLSSNIKVDKKKYKYKNRTNYQVRDKK